MCFRCPHRNFRVVSAARRWFGLPLGNRVLVDVEGQRVTRFDPESRGVRRERQWFEPKREPKRPEVGYIGLQNHDPGDVVWFRQISVRPLSDAAAD